MKKITILVYIILLVNIGFAQQNPMYSNYSFSNFILNPAMTGSVSYVPIRFVARQQWQGIAEAPKTISIVGSSLVANNKLGVGGYILSDKFGAINQNAIQLNLSYQLEINNNHNLSFGIGGKGMQYVFNKNDLNSIEDNDLTLQSQTEQIWAPEADFGLLFYENNHKYFFGISGNQLIEYDFSIGGEGINKLARHFFMMGGYKFNLNDDFDIEPSVVARYTKVAPLNANLYLKTIFKNKYWLSISYRTSSDIMCMLGIEYSNFIIGYTYEYSFGVIRNYQSGSHEIVLGYNFGKRTNSGSTLL